MKPMNGAIPVPGPTIMMGTAKSLGSRKKLFTLRNILIWKLKETTWLNTTH